MGGGWAGVYFTTYAMHALPAALVIESELIGSLSLVLVAAGMIVHSLRYGSQTLTGLAYVSAYAPLAFSPLSTFSLAATVPLTASLLVVSNRFAWSGVAVLGLASTYAIFILRTSVPGCDGATRRPCTWCCRRTGCSSRSRTSRRGGDYRARRRTRRSSRSTPWDFSDRFCCTRGPTKANGCSSARPRLRTQQALSCGPGSPPAPPIARTTRRRRCSARRTVPRPSPPRLFAYAIDLRFSGTRETVALLVETQLLVAAGVTMADRHIRRIGTAVAMLTTAHLGAVLLVPLATTGFHSVLAASPTALLVAAAWYFNREWLQRRNLAARPARVSLQLGRAGPGAERHRARSPRRISRAHVARMGRSAPRGRSPTRAGVSPPVVCRARGRLVPDRRGVRRESSGEQFGAITSTATCGLLFRRSSRWPMDSARAPDARPRAVGQSMELRIAAAVAFTIGTGFLTVFEWHLAPIDALPAVWAATAAAATAFGVWRGGVVFRWHGYSLAALATLLPLAGLAVDQVDSRQDYVSTIAVIAFLYIVGYIGRTVAVGAGLARVGRRGFRGLSRKRPAGALRLARRSHRSGGARLGRLRDGTRRHGRAS